MKPWCNQMIAAVEQFIDVTAGAYLTSSAAAHAHMAEAKKKFNENVNQNFLQILKDFVNKDLADALRQKNEMEKARLDLDSAKNKLKNAKTEENKAKFKAEVEKFQATYDREQDETTVMLRDTHNAFEKLKDAFKQFAAEEKAYYSTCMEECAKLCELP
ncbi:unnamed protein product [Schistocephalus solidus]|uniref:BAR domain-containing protein n=1 Tax=Schistocephalus solidus TaxID=70667 RepID=A0A183SF52_SCHSO|nr:unnamed protein product [Schistocephalus solidus]